MKKILAGCLAAVLLFCFAAFAFAEDADDGYDGDEVPETEEETGGGDWDEEPEEPEEPSGDEGDDERAEPSGTAALIKSGVSFEANGRSENFGDMQDDDFRTYFPLKDKKGWLQHKVVAGDTLIRLANKYNVPNWRLIRDWNPHIDPKTNMIINGEYLWIKKY